ncbi:hypothetical protein [Bradyrhizobium manausense]|uniref:hypothetical protein n=1 Tax=Bradyrhizobium manausense TaxID=989370 RepID=UPI002012BEFD|nr:hypothetical protein [Bradyrhizobium manausense]
MADQFANTLPSAAPTEAGLRAWKTLSRGEQVRLYRGLFAHPDCNTFTPDTANDILFAARQRVAERSRG